MRKIERKILNEFDYSHILVSLHGQGIDDAAPDGISMGDVCSTGVGESSRHRPCSSVVPWNSREDFKHQKQRWIGRLRAFRIAKGLSY
jgi:hypothetical protein